MLKSLHSHDPLVFPFPIGSERTSDQWGEPALPNPTPRKDEPGASLVAQWWRICPTMQETQVWSLIQEDPTCCGATESLRYNNCAPEPRSPTTEPTTEPSGCDYWGLENALRNSDTRETTARGPCSAPGEQPPIPGSREKPMQLKRPSTTKSK